MTLRIDPARGVLIRLGIGLVAIWLVLQASAELFGSYRGEAGGLVMVGTVATALLVERFLFGRPLREGALALGLGRPFRPALVLAIGIVALLATVGLAAAMATKTELRLLTNAPMLALGMLAQGGIAEEVLFRGYLFGHIRAGRPFWPAAWWSMVPFVAVHLLLFASLPPAIAAASLAVAVLTAFPFARLYESGGFTVWAPALVHAGIQGIKLFDLAGPATMGFTIAWMLASCVVPWLAFLAPRTQDRVEAQT